MTLSRGRSMTRIWQAIVTLLASYMISACDTLQYYSQAAHGQWQILSERQPIPRLLENPDTPAPLKQKLELILAARKFAQANLALKVDDAYSQYADLKRPYVVWNIVAVDEFSTEPKEFCFPIAGCLRYKGYFDEAMAQRDAEQLRQQGHDVYVGGVAAYSSLGWFNDPVLNTFINRDDAWLVALIFHESTHRTLYFPGDSRFNESLATAVEQAGLKQWLQKHGDASQFDRYLVTAQRQDQFVALVSQYKNKLDEFYRNSQAWPVEQRRAGKTAIYQELKDQYAVLKQSWNQYPGYDNWFKENLNNAKISAVATYNDLTPLFSQLLERQQYDYNAFFKRLKDLQKLPPDQRISQLKQWLE